MLKLKVRCIINFTLVPDSAVGGKAKKQKKNSVKQQKRSANEYSQAKRCTGEVCLACLLFSPLSIFPNPNPNPNPFFTPFSPTAEPGPRLY